MRAITYERFGPPEVLQVQDVPRPEPGAGQVLVQTRAISVTTADARIRGSNFPPGFALPGRLMMGVFSPRYRQLGVEVAGQVVQAGEGARFQVGDSILAYLQSFGGYAEYVLVGPKDVAAAIPQGLSMPQAASLCFGGLTAWIYLHEWLKVRRDERVLVIGATGAVGSAMVQVATGLGAQVTGVCSGRSLELVRELGAVEVIDYTQQDLLALDRTWDVVVDAVGAPPNRSHRGLLTAQGRYALVVGGLGDLLTAPLWTILTSHRVVAGDASASQHHLDALLELVEAGSVRPLMDRTFAFDQVVDAHRYVETGRKRGNIVLEV